MSNTFFASDHHFGHANMLNFVQKDGVTPCRSFSSVDEMNETMIDNHNRVVGNKDTCWFLGDVVINRRFLELVQRMRGRKRLILGNHDIFKNRDYLERSGFEDLHAFRKFDRFVATHVPVHPDSLDRWGVNVHGHTHNNNMMRARGVDARTGEVLYSDQRDNRYLCVCVEQINYTPVSIEEIHAKITA